MKSLIFLTLLICTLALAQGVYVPIWRISGSSLTPIRDSLIVTIDGYLMVDSILSWGNVWVAGDLFAYDYYGSNGAITLHDSISTGWLEWDGNILTIQQDTSLSGDNNIRIVFVEEDGSEHSIIWDDADDRFTVSDAVIINGQLEVATTAGALLLPRLTTVERDDLTPVSGMIIYNTTDDTPQFYGHHSWQNF